MGVDFPQWYLARLCVARPVGGTQLVSRRFCWRALPPGSTGEPAAAGHWLWHLTRTWPGTRTADRACSYYRRNAGIADPGLAGVAQCLLAAPGYSMARFIGTGHYLRGRDGCAFLDHIGSGRRSQKYIAGLSQGSPQHGITRC